MCSNLIVSELFESVQGETAKVGIPTTFVRLTGCPWRCRFCDSKHAYFGGKTYSVQDLIGKVSSFGHKDVCITGGEPLLQKGVYPLMDALIESGFILSLETGGAFSLKSINSDVQIVLDVKCPGSGHAEDNDFENLQFLQAKDAVKFVLTDEKDFHFALDICKQFSLFKKGAPHVLFSPAHGILNPKHLIDWMLKYKLPARLNLQIHKYIWNESTLGV